MFINNTLCNKDIKMSLESVASNCDKNLSVESDENEEEVGHLDINISHCEEFRELTSTRRRIVQKNRRRHQGEEKEKVNSEEEENEDEENVKEEETTDKTYGAQFSYFNYTIFSHLRNININIFPVSSTKHSCNTRLLILSYLLLYCAFGRCAAGFVLPEDDDLEDFEHAHGFRLRRSPEAFQALKDVESLIPANYSIHEPPPTENGNATKVNFSVIIMNVRDIKEINEGGFGFVELSLEMNLRMYWKDSRLSHLSSHSTGNSFLVLNPNLLDKIWHPDVFVDHVKSVSQPALISKPASLRIYPESVVRYSARVTLQMSCPMNFHFFPADTQRCHVDMKSYAYTNKVLDLGWREHAGAFLADKLELPNFDVALDNTMTWLTNTSSGSYSTIRFTIRLRRKLSYHLIQTYLPSALFIIVSWLSFLIPPESVPGRMACCMTTLLTLTAMFAAVRQNTPNVSYVKALDIWMVVCIVFVFLTLVEYTVVLKLKSLKPKNKYKEKKDDKSLDTTTLSSLPGNNGINGSTNSIPTISHPSYGYGEYPTIQMRRQQKLHETSFNQLPQHNERGDQIRRHPSEPSVVAHLPPLPLSAVPTQLSPTRNDSAEKTPNKFEYAAKKLEKFTATIIPLLFICFNFIYWPWLIERAQYYTDL